METETKRIVHHVPRGYGGVTATCGHALGVTTYGYTHTGRCGVPKVSSGDAAVCGHCLVAVS